MTLWQCPSFSTYREQLADCSDNPLLAGLHEMAWVQFWTSILMTISGYRLHWEGGDEEWAQMLAPSALLASAASTLHLFSNNSSSSCLTASMHLMTSLLYPRRSVGQPCPARLCLSPTNNISMELKQVKWVSKQVSKVISKCPSYKVSPWLLDTLTPTVTTWVQL